MVAERMRRHPDRLAVLDDARSLSYGELDRRTDTIAAGLQAAGVRLEDLVAVFLSRTVDIVAGLLAVHRLGAAYVPLDPEYPAERLDLMVADSAPRAARRRGDGGPLRLAPGRGHHDAARRRAGRGRAAAAGRPGVRDLHLRLHRPA
jgi:non-ribosomal peptide synthetase component F